MSSVPRWRWDQSPESPAEVVAVLRQGGVVAIPTESSYGLAVDPCNPQGVERVYRLKRREAGKPLPVVAADTESLRALGVNLEGAATEVLVKLWPAPLTLVLPLGPRQGLPREAPGMVPLPAAAGRDTLAVRVPDHAGLRRLLAVTGPVTATSANRSGEAPVLDPDQAADLLEVLERRGDGPVLVVDGGILPGGLPSTLVEPPATILRPGRFPAEHLPAASGIGRSTNER